MAGSHIASARTEPPTAERLRRAREAGELGPDPALVGGVALVAGLLSAGAGAATAWRTVAAFTREVLALRGFARASTGSAVGGTSFTAAVASAGDHAARLWAMLVGVPLLAAVLAALVAGWLETRGLFRLAEAVPDVRRLFGGGDRARGPALSRGLAPLLPAATLAAVAALWLGAWLPALARSVAATPAATVMLLAAAGQSLGGWLLMTVAGSTVAQSLWWRAARRRGLMMTRDDVRRELRSLEGDPGLKRERRRRARAAHDGIAGATIDCVVFGGARGEDDGTSATFGPCSVALRYRPPDDAAPVVMARAEGDAASSMVEQALGRGTPCRENLGLARALLHVSRGAEIPAALHEPVAQVFAELP